MAQALARGRSAVRRQWHGAAIQLADVVGQINRLQAEVVRLEAAEGQHIQPRSKVVDVVVVAANADEAERAASIVGDLADRHPCRAVIVLDEPGSGESRIDAAVTVAVSSQIDCDMCQYEEVFLRCRGPVAEHIPSLVDSLLVSDVPGFLWWTGSPPMGSRRFLDALEVADVALLDSARFEDPESQFFELVQIAQKTARVHFGDFAWSRIHPWRELVAQFFNPADRRRLLPAIRSVEIDHSGSNHVSAALFAGWLSATLGWRGAAVARDRDGLAVTYRGGRRVTLRPGGLIPGIVEGDLIGLSISAEAGGASASLAAERDADEPADVHLRGTLDGRAIARRVWPLPPAPDEALLSDQLANARSERLFMRAAKEAGSILRRAR